MKRKKLLVLALACWAALLTGCAKPELPAPLRVDLPTICNKILVAVPLPPAKPSDDARVAYLKNRAALITADGRIDAGRGCLEDMQRQYGAEEK